jgi:chromosome partitioning protein
MAVIAVVNRKGGSGKSTLATHLAAFYAGRGDAVMLGDIDRQQSTQVWLRRRAAQALPHCAPIVGWAVDPKRVLRPPAGVRHVVLDTPGGLRGFDLARVVAFADVIVMPVCHSVFDRESAAECHAELKALPRVAEGRCKVIVVGMRVDGRTRGAEALAAWAAGLGVPLAGVLREAQAYVRSIERGLTVFDLPPAQAAVHVAEWQPIVDSIEPVLHAVHRPVLRTNASVSRPAPERDRALLHEPTPLREPALLAEPALLREPAPVREPALAAAPAPKLRFVARLAAALRWPRATQLPQRAT